MPWFNLVQLATVECVSCGSRDQLSCRCCRFHAKNCDVSVCRGPLSQSDRSMTQTSMPPLSSRCCKCCLPCGTRRPPQGSKAVSTMELVTCHILRVCHSNIVSKFIASSCRWPIWSRMNRPWSIHRPPETQRFCHGIQELVILWDPGDLTFCQNGIEFRCQIWSQPTLNDRHATKTWSETSLQTWLQIPQGFADPHWGAGIERHCHRIRRGPAGPRSGGGSLEAGSGGAGLVLRKNCKVDVVRAAKCGPKKSWVCQIWTHKMCQVCQSLVWKCWMFGTFAP